MHVARIIVPNNPSARTALRVLIATRVAFLCQNGTVAEEWRLRQRGQRHFCGIPGVSAWPRLRNWQTFAHDRMPVCTVRRGCWRRIEGGAEKRKIIANDGILSLLFASRHLVVHGTC